MRVETLYPWDRGLEGTVCPGLVGASHSRRLALEPDWWALSLLDMFVPMVEQGSGTIRDTNDSRERKGDDGDETNKGRRTRQNEH